MSQGQHQPEDIQDEYESLPNWNDGLSQELNMLPSGEGDRIDAVRSRVGVGATTRQPSSDVIGAFHWQGEDQGTKRKSLTPQKSGLSGRALRMQSSHGGEEKGEPHGEGGSDARTTVVELDSAPRTTFKGILKKLDFPSTAQATPAGQTIHAPMTATKRLTFTSHLAHAERGRDSSSWNTPLSSTNGQMVFGSLGSQMTLERRRVTFGRVTDDDDVIAEGDEGEEEHDDDVCPMSVNSRNAGSTPFDKRLSSLFNRYTPSEEGEEIDHVIEHATEDADGVITKDQLASALRRSLLFVDRYNRSKSQEGDTQRPPMYGVISPTTGVLSMPFREEEQDRTPSMSTRRNSAGFSFAPAVTPELPQYSGTPDFSFSSPKTENTRHHLTPQSCSPNLLSLYGKARRVVPEEEKEGAARAADMVAAMSLKEEQKEMPRRSPRLAKKNAAKKKRDSLSSQNASSGGKIQLSPTEQSIRNSLRRKSTLGNSNST
ncbi:hypothetical protein M9434_005740 [Picochlorum sp. BPE23]|nr:hypothetical protein M9434_005740 [Picochlorum sp. BPE23]